jgi:Cu+-exporting ATPase
MAIEQTLSIGGMTCAACVSRVEKVLARVPGVTDAQVNLITEKATIHSSARIAFDTLKAAVEKAGYTASLPSQEASKGDPLWPVVAGAVLSAPLVLPMLPGWMEHGMPMLPGWGEAVLAGIVQIGLGWRFVWAGGASILAGAASMDVLVAIGSWAAFLLSLYGLYAGGPLYFESSAVVITLVLLGRYLEGRARRETGAAIRALAKLQPVHAQVRRDGQEHETALADLRVGDLVVTRPGERVAVDGVLTEGSGALDVSHMTGESMPVQVAPGAKIMAGAINLSAVLVVRAEHVGAETTLGRMIRLVEDAQASKPPIQKLADRISAVFVPVVLGIAVLTYGAWLLAGLSQADAIINAVSVLVIACPCALGLATPAAIMAGTGVAAKYGILIRDADVLAHAGSVRTVVFDKTGTLTEGHPKLVETLGADPKQVLAWAASLQSGSLHPLARSVLAASGPAAAARDLRDLPGRGVSGWVGEQQLRLGSPALLAELGLAKGTLGADEARLMKEGCSIAWLMRVSPDPAMLGLLAFADTARPSAAAALAGLKAAGLRTVMLSGDNAGSVAHLASMIGIDDAHAGVLPADKAMFIKKLHEDGTVVMVGDGVNDAPALASADIGIAMGEGTDVAMQTASITLMRPDLGLVAAALDIARATQRRIWQGLGWAFVFNLVGIPLAAFGLLSPVIAGGAMACSSLAVVLNALWLRRWHPVVNAPGYSQSSR